MNPGIARACAARAVRAALVVSCLFAVAACALPHVTQRPAQSEYRLRPPAVEQPEPGLHAVTLRVAPVLAAPGLDGVDMLYSPRPLQLMPYRDSRWIVPPAQLIGSALRQSLARQAWVAALDGEGMPGPGASWVLACRLERLEHDVYARSVVMELRCQLFDESAAGIHAAWDFDATRPMARQDAAAYAQAAQDLLDQAVAGVLRHTAQALRQAQRAPAPGASRPAAG